MKREPLGWLRLLPMAALILLVGSYLGVVVTVDGGLEEVAV